MLTRLLVDGNNLFSRASFAAKGNSVTLSSADGEETGALLLAVNMLAKYVRLVNPDEIVVAWDRGHDWRDEMLPGYKANRKSSGEHTDDDDHHRKSDRFEWFLAESGIANVAVPGWEADDVIAYCVRNRHYIADPPPVQCRDVILSGDKDLLQLVGQGVTQIRLPADEETDHQGVIEMMGVKPTDLPVYLALVGDTSDNVPGVRGIGPKKAIAIMEESQGLPENVVIHPKIVGQAVVDFTNCLAVVDLLNLRYGRRFTDRIDAAMGEVKPVSFTREPPASLLMFLASRQMTSIIDKWRSGQLWEPEPEIDTGLAIEGAFAAFDKTV